MLPVFLLVVLLALLVAARARPVDLDPAERALASRAAPLVAGVVSALCAWAVWGSLDAAPLYHDEGAYLLQAELFASGRWAHASPPLPEFFEQMYVLVDPVLASKYPPGHSLLLAAGALVGLPGLVPVLLTGLAGALLFALARRVANPWVALLAVVLWIGTPANLHFRASYFSETTTSACLLLAWWLVLDWRDTGRRLPLLLAAAVVGWGAITRPMTMFVVAIPLGVAVVLMTARRRRWSDLAGAVAVGSLVLLVLPLWSWRTLGSAARTPLATYQAQYIPFDVPGYRAPTAQGTRALPPDLAREREFLRAIKAEQVSAGPARLLLARARFLGRALFGDWRVVLAPAAVVGLFALGAAGAVAVASAVLLVLSYLAQAHTADWIVYYVEAFPVVAFVTALGAWRIASLVAARANGAVRGETVVPEEASEAMLAVGGGPPVVARAMSAAPAPRLALVPPGGASSPLALPPRPSSAALALLVVAVAALLALPGTVAWWRGAHAYVAAEAEQFRRDLARIPEERAVVFVRYKPDHDPHFPLVLNRGDFANARVWLAHDRGGDNRRLMAAAPDRAAYLYDEATNTFYRMARP